MLDLVDSLGNPNFHRIAFEEFLFAMMEGKHEDSEYVRKKSYERYEKEIQNTRKAKA
jgi:hypothetical protein